jgi:Zn-dependent protease/CBS domain-containing protein
MQGGVRVARLFGINIVIDWSWFFIFMLVTWHLAAGVFPTVHPEWSLALNLGVSLAASVLFFGSVLAHELAHALVAKWRGLPVRRITLFIFGGAADIGREPPTPKTEFLIAVVGPVMSAVLGILFLAAGIFLVNGGLIQTGSPAQVLAALGPAATLMLWLGPINILLAIFNMVPGFPLDGGRILRSILWAITNNMRQATRWASQTGQLAAWLFIGTGIAMVFGINVPFFGTGFLGGLWLVFIGWFLNNAASAGYRQAVVQDLLDGIPVEQLMRPGIRPVDPYSPISQLVYEHIIGSDEQVFPAVINNQLVGIINLDDIKKVPRNQWENTLVSEVMSPVDNMDIISPREEALVALEKLSMKDTRQLAVVQAGRFLGILKQRDISRWLRVQGELSTERR